MKTVFVPTIEQLETLGFKESGVVEGQYALEFTLNEGTSYEENINLLYYNVTKHSKLFIETFDVNGVNFYPQSFEELKALCEILKPE